MPLTTLDISIWSVAEDPPTRMAEAPIFSTSLANFFEDSNLKLQSLLTQIIMHFSF